MAVRSFNCQANKFLLGWMMYFPKIGPREETLRGEKAKKAKWQERIRADFQSPHFHSSFKEMIPTD